MNNFASYIEDLELRLEDLKTLRITFSGDYEEGRRDMLTNIIAELLGQLTESGFQLTRIP